MPDFVKVASRDSLPPGSKLMIEVGERSIAVFNVEGSFYAIDDICTHDGGPLCEGELEGDAVTCPWHFSRFNIRTGEVIDSPAHEPVRSYPVRVENEAILVGKPTP